MGRRTFESLGGILPNRFHIVITNNKNYEYNNNMVKIITNINDIMKYMQGKEENFVIGGATIYKMLIPYVEKMYITKIEEEFQGDTYFPEIDENEWRIIQKENGKRDEKNPYDYQYITYVRK